MTIVLEKLSPRQKECLLLAADGYGYRAIAEELGMGLQTVKVIMQEARDRLGASSTTNAVVIAWRRGEIEL